MATIGFCSNSYEEASMSLTRVWHDEVCDFGIYSPSNNVEYGMDGRNAETTIPVLRLLKWSSYLMLSLEMMFKRCCFSVVEFWNWILSTESSAVIFFCLLSGILLYENSAILAIFNLLVSLLLIACRIPVYDTLRNVQTIL